MSVYCDFYCKKDFIRFQRFLKKTFFIDLSQEKWQSSFIGSCFLKIFLNGNDENNFYLVLLFIVIPISHWMFCIIIICQCNSNGDHWRKKINTISTKFFLENPKSLTKPHEEILNNNSV